MEGRARLLAELATGIGGSEIHNLWNLEPYGCRRRLWYQKTGATPDFPRVTNRDMERGSRLEAIVADLYAEQTERKLVPGGFARDEDEPWLIVHPDRLIDDRCWLGERETLIPGVLEIKCPSVRAFLKAKREGLPEAWVLQLQHGLAVKRYSWGAFAVFSAELWELLAFDVTRDDDLIDKIRQEAAGFWRTVENGPAPDRLPPDDRRCQDCPFRTQCQGAALLARVGPDAGRDADHPRDDSLVPILAEYAQARQLQEEAEVLVDLARHKLEAALGDRQRLVVGGAKVYFAARKQHVFDAAAFRAAHAEEAKKYVREIVVRPLRVYGNP